MVTICGITSWYLSHSLWPTQHGHPSIRKQNEYCSWLCPPIETECFANIVSCKNGIFKCSFILEYVLNLANMSGYLNPDGFCLFSTMKKCSREHKFTGNKNIICMENHQMAGLNRKNNSFSTTESTVWRKKCWNKLQETMINKTDKI